MRGRSWSWLSVWKRKSSAKGASWSHLAIPFLNLVASLLKDGIQRVLGRSRHRMQWQVLTSTALVCRSTVLLCRPLQRPSHLFMSYLFTAKSHLLWFSFFELSLMSLFHLESWWTLILLLGEPHRRARDPCWSSLTGMVIQISSSCHGDCWIRSNLLPTSRFWISYFRLI